MPLHFERTTNLDLVRVIVTHPKLYPWMTDDGAPPPERFQPADHPAIWYVLAGDGAQLLGMWMLAPENSITAVVHTCLLPGHGYRRARIAAREFAVWCWEHTPFKRLVTSVPAFNRTALAFARDAGMVEYGVNPKSFQKLGKLHDQHLLGISRPEE